MKKKFMLVGTLILILGISTTVFADEISQIRIYGMGIFRNYIIESKDDSYKAMCEDISQYKPIVIGSDEFKKRIDNCLNSISDFEEYIYIQNINVIIENTTTDMDGQRGVFFIGKPFMEIEPDVYVASALVHEGYHMHLKYEGEKYYGEIGESKCLMKQKDVLIKLKAPQCFIDAMDTILNTKWWETSYEDREY